MQNFFLKDWYVFAEIRKIKLNLPRTKKNSTWLTLPGGQSELRLCIRICFIYLFIFIFFWIRSTSIWGTQSLSTCPVTLGKSKGSATCVICALRHSTQSNHGTKKPYVQPTRLKTQPCSKTVSWAEIPSRATEARLLLPNFHRIEWIVSRTKLTPTYLAVKKSGWGKTSRN